jgi:hypothetical protein
MVTDLVAQHVARTMQPHVQIADGDPELACYAGWILAVEVHALERLCVGGAQGVEQANTAGAWRVNGGVVACELDGLVVAPMTHGIGAMLAVVIDDGVPQDAVEPRTCASRILEGSGSLRRAHERTLDDVVGVGLVPHTQPREAHEARSLTGKGLCEGTRIHGD